MNAPNTGPSERLYGNWMRFSISRGTVPPPNQSTKPPVCPAAGANLEARLRPGHFGPISARAARAITRSSRAVTTRTRTRASGVGDVGVTARRRVGIVVDVGAQPRKGRRGTSPDLGAVLADPTGEDERVETSERADHRSDPRDEPVHEDVDREPGPLVAAVARR